MTRRSARIVLAAGLLAAGALLPANGAMGAYPLPTVHAVVGDACQLGGAFGTTPMDAEVRNAKGRSKGVFAATVNASGWSATCSTLALRPGDTILLRDGGGNPLRSFTMPVFRVSLDRVGNRVTGVAKGVRSLDLHLYQCFEGGFGCSSIDTGPLEVAADGTFRYAPAMNLTSIHRIALTWVKDGDRVLYQASFPKLVLTRGSSRLSGTGEPGVRAVITDRRAGTVASSVSSISPTRTLKGILKRNGTARRLKAGDRINWSLAGRQQARFTVPDVSMTVGPTATSGVCFPERRAWVRSSSPDGSNTRSVSDITEADGSFTIPMTYEPGWLVTVECWTGEGDVIRLPSGIVPG